MIVALGQRAKITALTAFTSKSRRLTKSAPGKNFGVFSTSLELHCAYNISRSHTIFILCLILY